MNSLCQGVGSYGFHRLEKFFLLFNQTTILPYNPRLKLTPPSSWKINHVSLFYSIIAPILFLDYFLPMECLCFCPLTWFIERPCFHSFSLPFVSVSEGCHNKGPHITDWVAEAEELYFPMITVARSQGVHRIGVFWGFSSRFVRWSPFGLYLPMVFSLCMFMS